MHTEPVGGSGAPPLGSTGSGAPAGAQPSTPATDAKVAAQEALRSKSLDLATILSVIAPGSGHFYMGSKNVPIAAGLLVATLVAVVLAYMSLVLFIVGFVIWLAAAAFAVNDLRGGVKGIENTSLPPTIVGLLLIAGGALLIISLILPWYHVTIDAGEFGSGGGSISGFEALGIIDIILLVIGVAAVVAGAAALNLGPVSSGELPRQLPLAVAIAAAVATVLILFRMFVDGAEGFGDAASVDVKIGRAPGILLALDAALILLIANASILRSVAKR